jgi:hypothetical protein
MADPGRADAHELLAEAERCCEKAARYNKSVSVQDRLSFEATRGCVLIEQGKTGEGEAVLRDVLDGFEDRVGRAYCLGYLAVAATRNGNTSEGRKYLEAACKLDPECAVLQRAARELELADHP